MGQEKAVRAQLVLLIDSTIVHHSDPQIILFWQGSSRAAHNSPCSELCCRICWITSVNSSGSFQRSHNVRSKNTLRLTETHWDLCEFGHSNDLFISDICVSNTVCSIMYHLRSSHIVAVGMARNRQHISNKTSPYPQTWLKGATNQHQTVSYIYTHIHGHIPYVKYIYIHTCYRYCTTYIYIYIYIYIYLHTNAHILIYSYIH